MRTKTEIKPDYYDDFSCSAGACDFTCCQEWKIYVDDATQKKWENIAVPTSSLHCEEMLADSVTEKEGDSVIRLQKGVCPFLDEKKLCRIVITYGDDCLSETCRVFPREIHKFQDREEKTLLMACPETINLLQARERFSLTCNVTEKSNAGLLFRLRSLFMDMIQDEASCGESLMAIFFIAKSVLEEGSEIPENEEIIQLRRQIASLPYNNEEHFSECNELFLDLVYNYREEGMYTKILTPLVPVAEKISQEGISAEPALERKTFAEQWLSHQNLMKKVLAGKIYGDLLMEDYDGEDMLLKLQWLLMEYVLMRHLFYLSVESGKEPSYENLRTCILVACRMMGYDDVDIREYMESSFEEIVWQWGYFSLLSGKV